MRTIRSAALVVTIAAMAVGVPSRSATALTVFKVTNTNDTGDGSLRRAINDAKNDPGVDAIFFKIPGPGVHVIQPLTDLPAVYDNIAGDSQPGYSGTPLIQIDGSLDSSQISDGVFVYRGIIAALDITNFRAGIRVFGPGTTIIDNYIGVDPGGTVAMGNRNGIVVWDEGTQIGDGNGHGNLISGNGNQGILLIAGIDTRIEGNLIGTNAAGNQAIPNASEGVFVHCGSHDNVIGGPGSAGNVISGNTGDGVFVGSNGSCGNPKDNVVQGNIIGLDAGGTFPIPNQQDGVLVNRSIGTHVGTWPSTGNVIAGNLGAGVEIYRPAGGVLTTVDSNLIGVNSSGGEAVPNGGPGVLIENAESVRVGQRIAPGHIGNPNVISGNQGGGIRVITSDMTNVFGNLIGTGSNGAIPVPNIGPGVSISGGTDTHVGGGVEGQGNVISANNGDGVVVRGDDATGTPAIRVSVQANFIGTDRAGQVSIGNGGNGIAVQQQADGTRIGNVVGIEGPNTIAHNSSDGVRVTGSKSVRIRGNSIFENSQFGINLLAGGNDLPLAPVLTNVKLANGQLTVKGSLLGDSSRDYSIEVFGNPICDPSGAGEGQDYLASHKVTTDSGGTATYTIKFAYGGAAAPVVTATDINSKNGNTSEFSACK
jgi:hypothetical protein